MNVTDAICLPHLQPGSHFCSGISSTDREKRARMRERAAIETASFLGIVVARGSIVSVVSADIRRDSRKQCVVRGGVPCCSVAVDTVSSCLSRLLTAQYQAPTSALASFLTSPFSVSSQHGMTPALITPSASSKISLTQSGSHHRPTVAPVSFPPVRPDASVSFIQNGCRRCSSIFFSFLFFIFAFFGRMPNVDSGQVRAALSNFTIHLNFLPPLHTARTAAACSPGVDRQGHMGRAQHDP